MTDKPATNVEKLVPGGILRTDFCHVDTFDETCSRCRKAIPEDDVPLLLWIGKGKDMYAYCRDCNGFDDDQRGAHDDEYGDWT